MDRWTPQKADVLDSLVEEFLHNYASGRTLLAVDGIDGAGKTRFADDLAERFALKGHTVVRASIDGSDVDRVRREVVAPFRSGATTAASRATLIVDGELLTGSALRGLWNWSVWLEGTAVPDPRTSASAIVDVSDPDHPRRVFADSC